MNIGEISKPSVERAQISKTLNHHGADPVAESKRIVDSVNLSDESKRRSKNKSESEQSAVDVKVLSSEAPLAKDGKTKAIASVDNVGEPKGLTIDIKV